jgi:hypothetical protein
LGQKKIIESQNGECDRKQARPESTEPGAENNGASKERDEGSGFPVVLEDLAAIRRAKATEMMAKA